MSRSRTADLERTDRAPTRSSSQRPQTTNLKKSSQTPRTTSGAADEANAGKHAFVKPPERTTSPTSSRRPNYAIDAHQARERLDKKLKRLEPPARSDEASRPRSYRNQAEDQPRQTETLAEQHDPMKLARDHGELTRTRTPQHAESRERSPSKKPRPRAQSQPTRTAKAVWCGNNKLDKKLKANGGHLDIGSPQACFRRGVGSGIHQEILPGEEDAFIEKWIQPYAKLVDQSAVIYYKDGPPPHGMISCTLPQALARGFAVGSIQRAKRLLKQRGHTTAHGA